MNGPLGVSVDSTAISGVNNVETPGLNFTGARLANYATITGTKGDIWTQAIQNSGTIKTTDSGQNFKFGNGNSKITLGDSQITGKW